MIDGKLVVRPYTPVTGDDLKGYVDLVIKVYFANEHPRFPDGGKMSQYLEHLPLGSTIDFRGPSGLLTYEGKGSFRTLTKKTDLNSARIVRARRLGMIAGGTGITPMYQLIKHILVHEPNNADTQMWLLYANQSVDDILLREELDALAAAHPRRLRVWYTVDRAPAAGEWTYSVGFVNADMCRSHLPPPAAEDDALIVMCGPPPMVQMACQPALDSLDYPAHKRFVY